VYFSFEISSLVNYIAQNPSVDWVLDVCAIFDRNNEAIVDLLEMYNGHVSSMFSELIRNHTKKVTFQTIKVLNKTLSHFLILQNNALI
jgi:hypothetical protein